MGAATPKRTPGAKRKLVKRLLGLGPKVEAATMGPKRVSLHQMPPHLVEAERSAEEAATAASAAAAAAQPQPQKPHPVSLSSTRLIAVRANGTKRIGNGNVAFVKIAKRHLKSMAVCLVPLASQVTHFGSFSSTILCEDGDNLS